MLFLLQKKVRTPSFNFKQTQVLEELFWFDKELLYMSSSIGNVLFLYVMRHGFSHLSSDFEVLPEKMRFRNKLKVEFKHYVSI